MRGTLVVIAATTFLFACTVTSRPPLPRPEPAQVSRLQRLLAERSREQVGYPIGAGDRLKVTVPNAEELSGEFFVANDGTITLPLIGAIPVSGKREEEVAEDIRQRLATEYLQSPEVIVTVASYKGRRISVTGSVGRPGFFELQGTHETILDILTRAGGVGKDASSTIYFTPAGASPNDPKRIAMAEELSLIPGGTRDGMEKDQVEIDLTNLYQGLPVPLLMLPVRDGDRIFVRPGGLVFVEGWVEKPSPYDLLPAMTLTQAVTKAGGLHFAASRGKVTLSREDRGGISHDYRVDYSALATGREKDIYLQPGDHVYVGGNVAKVGVWSVYNVFATVVRFTVGGAIALF
jgi:polysaccharide export outer membrane protein